MDPIQEVAEAAAKRREQIRKWQQEQVDSDKAVTFLENPLPKDPSPEEVQKVNMQGADETLGGPANEDATVKGEAPTYEDAADVAAKAEDAYPADKQDTGPDYVEVEEEPEAGGESASEEAAGGGAETGEDSSGGEVSDGEDGDSAESEEVEAPAHSAKKAEWVEYRVKTHGLTEEEAEGYTKDELIALD